MSYHNYLVLNEAEILVDIGNHVSKETWLEEVEVFKRLYRFQEGEVDYFDTSEVKFKDVNLRDFMKLLVGYETAIDIANCSSHSLGLVLGMVMKNPRDYEIVGEAEVGKKRFKNFKVLSMSTIE